MLSDMKKSHIVFLVLIILPLAIHIYLKGEDLAFLYRLFAVALYVVGLIIASVIAALAGGIILHFSLKFYYWLFCEEPREKREDEYGDVTTYLLALWPVTFAVGYYFIIVYMH